MLDLFDEGQVDPTAQQVADRAGVSLRTVFHHFQSMEAVFAECWRLQSQRQWSEDRLPVVSPDGALGDRLRATVEARCDLFERVAGPRRAAVRRATASPILAKGLAESSALLRRLLADTFAAELARDDQPEVLLDALDTACSFEAWDRLRRDVGRSPEAVVEILFRTTSALLPEDPP